MSSNAEVASASSKDAHLSELFLDLRSEFVLVFETLLTQKLSYDVFMRVYTKIYEYCNYRGANESFSCSSSLSFYLNLKEFLKEFITVQLFEKEIKPALADPASLCSAYGRLWENFDVFSTTLDGLCQYIDRFLVPRGTEGGIVLVTVKQLCRQIWKEEVFVRLFDAAPQFFDVVLHEERLNSLPLNQQFRAFVLSAIHLESEGGEGHLKLALYKRICEVHYLNSIEAFFSKWSAAFLTAHPESFDAYAQAAEAMLLKEEARIEAYLHESSHSTAKNTLYDIVIRAHSELLRSYLQEALKANDLGRLERFYKLISRCSNFEPEFTACIEKISFEGIGEAIAAVATRQLEYPSVVFFDLLKAKFTQYKVAICSGIWQNNYSLTAAVDKAFKAIINKNALCSNSRVSAELLAKYTDLLLKKTASKPIEETVDYVSRIGEILDLFMYLEEKDVFQQHYAHFLSRRIINGTIENDEMESLMISKLKDACGFEFTNKFQKMFTDNTLGKEINEAFRASSVHQAAVDSYFQVLCTGSWPFSVPEADAAFVAPSSLAQSTDAFAKFYCDRHTGRKLTWLYQFCRAEVKANYSNGASYIFLASAYQVAILALFNDADTLSFEQISKSTQLSADTLACIMEIFLRSKVLIGSNCSLDSFESLKSGSYTYNKGFSSKKIRINLNMPLKAEVKVDADRTAKNIEEDRSFLIQAAIVRIMKSKKTLKHVNLVDETIGELQSKFTPKVPDVKRSIEHLLEREYLERSKDAHDVLVYVA